MSTADGKLVVRQFWNEVVNQGRFEVIDRVFTPDCTFHDPLIGKGNDLDTVKYFVRMIRTAFPDVEVSIQDQKAAERGSVITHWVGTGTHTGQVEGVEPTGESVTMPGTSISRVVNGRIEEVWLVIEPLEELGSSHIMSLFCRYFPRLC